MRSIDWSISDIPAELYNLILGDAKQNKNTIDRTIVTNLTQLYENMKSTEKTEAADN